MKARKLTAATQDLKTIVGSAVEKYKKNSELSDLDYGFVVTNALTLIAASHTQEVDGASKAAFLGIAGASWDFVEKVYKLKADYDRMTPEERQKVIDAFDSR
jgi:hypothetical protein